MIFRARDSEDADYWNSSSIDEEELFRRLDIGGRALVCDFGRGRQGVVYMTEDGNFVKITRSRREAALAASILAKPRPGFPRIDGVGRFEIGDTPLFAIYREGVDDVCEGDEPFLSNVVNCAWTDLSLVWPPKHHSPHVRGLQELSPDIFGGFYDLLGHLQDLADSEGLVIRDVHIDNIGMTESGEIVVRDLGFHNLSQDEVEGLVSAIEHLPDPGPSPSA